LLIWKIYENLKNQIDKNRMQIDKNRMQIDKNRMQIINQIAYRG